MSDPDSSARPGRRTYRIGIRVLDRVTDTLTLTGLASMVILVAYQVFCRYVLGFTPTWVFEIALLLLIWLAFLGIALGIREHAHIVFGFIVDRMPRRTRAVVTRLGPALMLAFGLYLVAPGGEFTQLMANSTLAETGLPTSVQYAAMPVSGVLITLYSALQLFGLLPMDGATTTDGDDRTGATATERDGEAR